MCRPLSDKPENNAAKASPANLKNILAREALSESQISIYCNTLKLKDLPLEHQNLVARQR
jgi:hypothetical protein